MFIDCLEVEDNLRMFSDKDIDDKLEKKLELVEPHKQKEIVLHANSVFCEQKDDQPSDVKEDGSTNLFFEDCNQLVTNFVSGDFKKDFSMPIYDEYEDVVPKKPAINFVNSRHVSEENMTVIQSQKDKRRKDSECAEGDCLPLFYSSFELLRKRLKASKQKESFEDMENFMNLLEVEDEEDEQSCSQSQHVEKSVVCNEELDYKERGKGS